MHSTFITGIFLLGCLNLTAQFTLSSDSIYVDMEAGEDYGTVDIQNDSIGGNILWILSTECQPEDWIHYVMDVNINYIPGIDSFSFALGAHETGILRVFLLQSPLPGKAKYSMEIWEEGNRENNKFVSFNFNGDDCEVTGVETFSEKGNLQIYPNPASSHFFIETNGGAAIIELYDMHGRKVFEQKAKKGQITEIVSSVLKIGVYTVLVKNSEGLLVNRGYVVKI